MMCTDMADIGNDDFRGSRRDRRQDDRRRRRHPFRALAGVVGVVALLGVLTIAGYLFFLQRTVEGNIERADLRPTENAAITVSPDRYGARQPGDEAAPTGGDASGERPGGEDDVQRTGGTGPGDDAQRTEGAPDEEELLPLIVSVDGEEMTVEPSEFPATTPERPTAAGDALNFLIVGSNSRDLSEERGRSDVIVLMHISSERDRVDLVHFPRDLFVPIAGTGGSAKINAASAYGGAPLLIQTLQPLIDVPIDHVVLVNFESFKTMTDAIGGVDVQVTEAGGGFSTGVHHMNGEEGLDFVRERYSLSQGDISRGERQMQFIKAIMTKALSRQTISNPARLAGFVDAASTNLTVDADLDVGQMRDLGFAMRSVRGGDIHFWQGPWRGLDSHPVAGSIVVMADGQMDVLSEHLQNDTMESYADDVSPRYGFGG